MANVFVAIRCRPPNKRETNQSLICEVIDERALLFDPKESSSDPTDFFAPVKKARKNEMPRDITQRRKKNLTFGFDHVFGQESKTVDVFEKGTKHLIDKVLEGFNCSVFAYGATGAGKTHTMLGDSEEPGVMVHTMRELFAKIEQTKETRSVEIAMSYLEVYNEQIKDLLSQSPGYLPLFEDSGGKVSVKGLSTHQPSSCDEIFGLLALGNSHRTQHPTDANAESSRSHAVCQIFVKTKELNSVNVDYSISKLSLIDLAGSERAHATANSGARFKEGANINRSLLALGNCINALASQSDSTGPASGVRKRKITSSLATHRQNHTPGTSSQSSSSQHVPYRDSKLTRLLKDSLGGSCHTVMIACVSPCNSSFDDTHNTLQYANRAKNIKVTMQKNVVSVESRISEYQKIIKSQQAEIRLLKDENCRIKENATIEAGSQLSQPFDGGPSLMETILETETRSNRLFNEVSALVNEWVSRQQEVNRIKARLVTKENSLELQRASQIDVQEVDLSVVERVRKKVEKSERMLVEVQNQLDKKLAETGCSQISMFSGKTSNEKPFSSEHHTKLLSQSNPIWAKLHDYIVRGLASKVDATIAQTRNRCLKQHVDLAQAKLSDTHADLTRLVARIVSHADSFTTVAKDNDLDDASIDKENSDPGSSTTGEDKKSSLLSLVHEALSSKPIPGYVDVSSSVASLTDVSLTAPPSSLPPKGVHFKCDLPTIQGAPSSPSNSVKRGRSGAVASETEPKRSASGRVATGGHSSRVLKYRTASNSPPLKKATSSMGEPTTSRPRRPGMHKSGTLATLHKPPAATSGASSARVGSPQGGRVLIDAKHKDGKITRFKQSITRSWKF